ncbi:hypothetical protein CKAN_02511400 [Cinnamomum micranthum f. kanehirae]|uniref:Phospholipase A2 family protein n=1 Tax=Cinnamomum micranthum f. kanehirae TaxID=337451 RepID=A0A3S3NWE7_9MAGN|nr:hypothetical protein CKAN_02511400 [Cinnamomum micranthum f. kanehirae]
MDVSFSNYLPRFRFRTNADFQPESKTIHAVKESFQHCVSNILLWKKSLQSIGSWANSAKGNFRMPSINRELQQYSKSNRSIESGCSLPLFRPYVAKVPWHKGVRAVLSQLFPRYGHYCGPNWSSGKDNGLPLWDQRPIDWLDFCCYCHDIGYDTDDQAKLLKADLAFLECLEKPRMTMKGDTHAAYLYRSMCITGLRNILIPYRRQLVRLQSGQHLAEWLGTLKGKSNTFERT